MQQKKAFEKPKLGVFYLVPEPKSGKYTIFSELEEDGADAVHLMLWDSVVELLRRRFRDKSVDIISDNYRGLPRGRIMEAGENQWKVAWGNDFPDEYKSDVISEFRLGDAQSLGKLLWEFQEHETMQAGDKKVVEKTLGITMSPQGFEQKLNSEKIIKEVVKKH
jgi:hypothetical protein